jgi:hypothetical protein
MRYRPRTLLILLALGPPILPGAWFAGEPFFCRLVWPPPTRLAAGQTVWLDPITGRWALAKIDKKCSQIDD